MNSDNWVMVPMEPTEEMLDAATQDGVCVDGRPVWKKDVVFQAKWKYQQMLAAAPAVQGEPVAGWPLHPSQVRALRRNVKRNCPPEIYALLDQAIVAPQPAEQKPAVTQLVEALEFYANGDHLMFFDENAWDTVSGEPQNWLCDEAGTAAVETGYFAKAALAAYRKQETSHE